MKNQSLNKNNIHINGLLVLCVIGFYLQCTEAQTQANTVQTWNYKLQGTDWKGICSSGSKQSPINIGSKKGSCDGTVVLNIEFKNQDIVSKIRDNKSTLKSDGKFSIFYTSNSNSITGYESSDIAVRVPSEHTIDNVIYDAEVQISFGLMDGFSGRTSIRTSFVSLLFKVVQKSETTFFTYWDINQKDQFQINLSLILRNISFDPAGQFYYYQGSYTYPPCTQKVGWYVYETPLSITAEQLRLLQAKFSGDLLFANGNGNNRAIQNRNGREPVLGNSSCQEEFMYFFSFLVLYIIINFFIFKAI